MSGKLPEQAAELESLLQTALAVREASAIQPRAEFRAKARYQFRSALQAMEHKRSHPLFGWLPRWATVVTVVLVLVLAGGSAVAAASNSMPDEPLYPVKLATEQVQLAFTFSNIGKAELYAKLADKRVTEIIYMAKQNNPEKVELLAQRLNICLVRIAVLAATDKEKFRALAPSPEEAGDGAQIQANRQVELRITAQRLATIHSARLRAVLETAPESVKPALHRAIAISVAGYEKVLEALD